jgi:hypothetical protein
MEVPMPPTDPREVALTDAVLTLCADAIARLCQQGYPAWLAYKEAALMTRQVLGIRLALVEPVITDEDVLFDVRQLSAQSQLEHDGSALNALLERYDYQWPLSDGSWHLTARTCEERLGFWAPRWTSGTPRLLWKPLVVRRVMALEQARQSLDGLAPGEQNLLQRRFVTPREWGQRTGRSTRAVNQRLQAAGYQTWEPHGRARRWEPTIRATQEQVCICGARGLEWLPCVFTPEETQR